MTSAEIQAAWRARCAVVESTLLPANVPALIDEAANRFAERPFLDFFEDAEALTYAGFAQASRALAAGLAAQGVTAGMRVAVMLPNRMAFPLTWIALARLGAMMVPVNPSYTARELDYVLSDSGAEMIVIDAAQLPVLAAAASRPAVVCFGGAAPEGTVAWEALAQSRAAPPAPVLGPDTLLNIQYTSGTTGFPKGCMLSHDYWLVLARGALAADAQPAARLLSAQPFFYMDPQWHLLKAALQGGRLFVARRPSLTRYAAWLAEFDIEWCQFPQLAMAHLPPGLALPRLKQSFNAGWRPEAQHRFAAAFPHAIGRDIFGMTEIGAGLVVPPEAAALVGSTSCGIPAPWRAARLVDEAGVEITGAGSGELHIAGRAILQGYWNKPEATLEAFDGAWFRTGDIFRRDAEGWLHLIGRRKDMIRRSGENIAAREVEAVMAALPEIADAAAVPVPDPARGEEVKLYLQFREGVALSLDALVAHARAHLAPFKVPRFWQVVEAFPRTPSNKIAKHLLIAATDDLRAGAVDIRPQPP